MFLSKKIIQFVLIIASFNVVNVEAAGTWGTVANVSDVIESQTRSLAIDAAGNSIAVWSQGIVGNQGIYSNTMLYGETWGTPAQFSPSSAVAVDTQVAVDPAGNATAVWQTTDGSDLVIMTAYKPFGLPWQDFVTISSAGEDASLPLIAVDASNNAVAVWLLLGSPATVKAAQRINGSWSAPTLLSTSGDGVQLTSLRLDVSSAGQATAAWETATTPANVESASVQLGSAWLPSQVAYIGSPTLQLGTGFDLSVGKSAGQGIIGFSIVDTVASTVSIVTIRQSTFGGAWSPPIFLTDTLNNNATITVDADSSANAVFVYSKVDPTQSFFEINSVSLLATDIVAPPETLLSQPGENSVTPAVAVNAAGDAVASWTNSAGANALIQASTLAFGGSWTTFETLSTLGEDSDLSLLSINARGDILLGWFNLTLPAFQAIFNTALVPPPPVIPPLPAASFSGKLVNNKFLTQTDRIYQLKWSASPDPTVTGYNLYRNGILLAQFFATGPFNYSDHNRNKKIPDVYTLTSLNAAGEESVALTVSFL